ncbi:GNAT family N-acetyltransferase [Demequina sp. NBRC 110055]|uniref:GNAT family N-acetyltransferase n=1 Tax=Demequina sp. NBRC 110055 TaxID=1570344 RepID=UPI0009FC7405|nr:GNAT family N-acetyltransferase [Demequina sp. NBRC 110055]
MPDAWLPADFEHPLLVPLTDGVHLRPIRPDDTDIDMVAVMGSQPMLWEKYGEAWGWPPADMTPEADRADLDRHAREMVTHESFNYAIMPTDEGAIYGCVYIDPPSDSSAAVGPVAEVSWWVVADAPAGLADAVAAFVPRWLGERWPFVEVRYPFGEVG